LKEQDFIFSRSRNFSLNGLKNFPSDFTDLKHTGIIEVPEKQLLLGKEFFGSYEVSTPAGDFVLTFNNEFEAKYIVYASQNRKNKIKVPKELKSIKTAVENYENYLDQLLNEIKKDYLARFSSGKNYTIISNEIFNKLNLIRL